MQFAVELDCPSALVDHTRRLHCGMPLQELALLVREEEALLEASRETENREDVSLQVAPGKERLESRQAVVQSDF